MADMSSLGAQDVAGNEDAGRFRSIRFLANHWSRPPSRRAYYWYLTFENCEQLHSLVKECQEAIAFPYYDLVSLGSLHLTLDRIAFEGDIDSRRLDAIETAATRACVDILPIDITIGSLGGTRGAVGFQAFPGRCIQELRDTFRAATLSAYPRAPLKLSEFHAHVAIAYANRDGVPAADAIAAVQKVNAALSPVDVTVAETALVILERRERSYAWRVLSRVPLSG